MAPNSEAEARGLNPAITWLKNSQFLLNSLSDGRKSNACNRNALGDLLTNIFNQK